MNASISRTINRILEQRRQAAERLRDRAVAQVYARWPQLAELDRRLAAAGADLLLEVIEPGRARLAGARLSALKAERLAFLREQGLAADFDQVALTCPVCCDSGQVDGKPCSCYRALLIPLLIEEANLAHLRGMTWADFNLSLFDDQAEPNRYQSDLSPRQQMIGLKKAAERFVSRFDQPDERSMLYIGKPGTGKTYLMACTAHALLQQGRPVLYLTAPQLFDRLQENRILLSSYNPDPERLERSSAMKDAILNSDLLLIDDLGTEAGAASRYADLLGVIDGRMAASRKMIISTNADPATLRDQYDERLLSRLVGSFAVYRFFGEDIRLQISRRRRA